MRTRILTSLLLVLGLALLTFTMANSAITVKEHSGVGYDGSKFVINSSVIDTTLKTITLNTTFTDVYPGVVKFDHGAIEFMSDYKVVVNVNNKTAYGFIALQAELYDLGEDGTAPIKYKGWSQSDDSDALDFNQETPDNPPRTSNVWTNIKADELGEQDWLSYYTGTLTKGSAGNIQFGLDDDSNSNTPFLLELTPNKSLVIPVYARYDFSYYYNNGAGDYYKGYFYAATNAGYDVNYTEFITDENNQQGYYKITKATYQGFLPGNDKQVYVTQYYDIEGGGPFIPLNSNLPIGTNSIGSEKGYIIQSGNTNYLFGQSNNTFYEADVPWIKVKEHVGTGYVGSYFTLNNYQVDYANKVITLNTTLNGPYPGVLWFDHAAGALDEPYKVVVNIKNSSKYNFSAMDAELYDVGEDGTSPIKYAGWSHSDDFDQLHFNQGSPNNPPRTSNVWAQIKADEVGPQDWLDYYDGILNMNTAGNIEFGLVDAADTNKPFLLELTPNKSWTILTYALYNFTYYYNDGKGDYYNGYFYAATNLGYDLNYIKPIAKDENNQPGFYKITKATYAGFFNTDNKKVFVTNYYDLASKKSFTPQNSTSPMGSNYFGSEYGYILRTGIGAYRFGKYGLNFYEADAYNKFYFRYVYGQGDYYSGYVYAAFEKYYPGWMQTSVNETGYTGYIRSTAEPIPVLAPASWAKSI